MTMLIPATIIVRQVGVSHKVGNYRQVSRILFGFYQVRSAVISSLPVDNVCLVSISYSHYHAHFQPFHVHSHFKNISLKISLKISIGKSLKTRHHNSNQGILHRISFLYNAHSFRPYTTFYPDPFPPFPPFLPPPSSSKCGLIKPSSSCLNHAA